LAQHPKSLLFLPLVMASGYFLVRCWWLRGVVGAACLVLAAFSYRYWTMRTGCPDDPAFEQALGKQSLSPMALLVEPGIVLRQAIENLMGSRGYLRHILFLEKYPPANWLPPELFPPGLAAIVNLGIRLAFLSLAAALVCFLWQIARSNKTLSRLPMRIWMVSACFLSLFLVGAVDPQKHFYASSLMLPLAGLAILVAVPADLPKSIERMNKFLTIGLVTLSLISQGFLWVNYLPQGRRILENGGYLPIGQDLNVSPADFHVIRTAIAEAASRCGIDAGRPLHHLVIDDLSYFVFMDSLQPFHVIYIQRGKKLWDIVELDADEVMALLQRWQSAGLIAGCHLLSPSLRDRVVQSGPFCCLPAFGPVFRE
jgi:hypothetical protein